MYMLHRKNKNIDNNEISYAKSEWQKKRMRARGRLVDLKKKFKNSQSQ